MKILRFIWDHPAICALGCVTAWLAAPTAIEHPFGVAAVLTVAALSFWAAVRGADGVVEAMQAAQKAELGALRVQMEAAAALARSYAEAGSAAREHLSPPA